MTRTETHPADLTDHGTSAPRRPSSRPAARLGSVALLAALAAAPLAVVMPRGPMTTGQSVAALLVAVAVGALAGGWTASRWAAPVALLGWVGAFELVRVWVDGPTVDALRFDSIFAVAAMVAGRGFDTLVMGVPLAVAAWCGAAWARRRAGSRPDAPSRGSWAGPVWSPASWWSR